MKVGKIKKITAIGLALVMSIGLIYSSNYVKAVSNINTDGLKLQKTATYKDDGTYDVELDAFTTGVVESNVASDIVLVIDQSTSMNEKITIRDEPGYKLAHEKDTTNIWDLFHFNSSILGSLFGWPYNGTDQKYYVCENNTYYPIEIKLESNNWSGHTGRKAILYYINENDQEIVIATEIQTLWAFPIVRWGWEADEKANIPIELYTYNDGVETVQKMSKVKEVANDFLDAISKNNEENNINSKVAVVGFANGKEWNGDKYNYSNTELFVKDQEYTYGSISNSNYQNAFQNPNDAKKSIEKLTTSGGTLTNYGLEIAKNVFEKNEHDDTNRKKVVVLLTDGQPGWSGFDYTVANTAIDEAENLKNNYNVTIYSVGFFEGADASDDTTRTNRFMNYTSSNYPYAKSMDNCGQKVEEKYFMKASNANGLDDIFDTIIDDITKPDIDLDSSTIISDTISEYFKITTNNDGKENVKIEVFPCTNVNGENYEFSDIPIGIPDDIKYTVKDKSINITGYDFNNHFVSKDDKGNVRGSKIKVTINVKPEDWFIGGKSVPTNADHTCGVIVNDIMIKEFNRPNVDVDLNYDFDTTSRAIYVGNQWSNVEGFIKGLTDGKVNYKIGGNTYNLTDYDYANDYVNIVYTFKDGEKEIGKYTILPGENNGNWEKPPKVNTGSLRNTHKYTVSVSVSNKNNDESTTDGHEQHNNVSENGKDAYLYLYVPNIQTNDKEIMLGDTLDLTGNVNLIKNDKDDTGWVKQNSAAPDRIEGNIPKSLDYSFNPTTNLQSSNYTPDKIGNQVFNVVVKNGVEDITEVSKFTHNNTIDHENHSSKCIQNDFIVKVIGGQIRITKTINNENQLLNNIKEDPIFGFKIEETKSKKVYYRYLRFTRDDFGKINDLSDYIVINDLPMGTYKVTELGPIRFKQISNDVEEINLNINSREGNANFTNQLQNDQNLSDNDVLVNTFGKDTDGSVTIGFDYLKRKE